MIFSLTRARAESKPKCVLPAHHVAPVGYNRIRYLRRINLKCNKSSVWSGVVEYSEGPDCNAICVTGEVRHCFVSASDCLEALKVADTKATRDIMNNTDPMARFVGVINGTLAALEGGSSAALGLADKWATIADAGGKMAKNNTCHAAASSAQILTQTLTLVKLGSNASPGMVVATVGAMFTKKVGLMFGLVDDNKQAAIVSATADVTASLLVVGTSIAALRTAAAGART